MRGLCLLAAFAAAACVPPEWGANAILHPYRKPLTGVHPAGAYRDLAVESGGIVVRGWLVAARAKHLGLLVYLHGSGDNRESGLGLAQRFTNLGFDVLLYDSRAHGESGGESCTYGYLEKKDLSKVLDAAGEPEAILFGSSLGAAVALQAAAVEPRIRGVVAQSPFSDLRSIVEDRAPFFATRSEIREAIALAEKRGGFAASEASPLAAARSIRVPVLLIHGERDRETPKAHSLRIAAALPSSCQLILVPRAGHNDTLQGPDTWERIEAFVLQIGRGGSQKK